MFDLLQLGHLSDSKLSKLFQFWFSLFVMVAISYRLFDHAGHGFKTFPVTVTTSDVIKFFVDGEALLFALYYLMTYALYVCVYALIVACVLVVYFIVFARAVVKDPIAQLTRKKYLIKDPVEPKYYKGPNYGDLKNKFFSSVSNKPKSNPMEAQDFTFKFYCLVAYAAFQFQGFWWMYTFALVAAVLLAYTIVDVYTTKRSVVKFTGLILTAPDPPVFSLVK